MAVRFLIALALLSACKVEDRTHPVIPGTPSGPVGGGTVDAAAGDAANGGGAIAGRVCLVADLRDVSTCAAKGAGGLTVALGTMSTTTSANGAFSIAAPLASNLVWQVSGAGIRTSIAPFSANALLPVIATVNYQELQADNGVLEVAGQGAILAHVVSSSAPHAPVAMATATTSPIGAYPALYDGKVARLWTQNSTGAHGAIWIPGLAAGTIALTVAPPVGVVQTVTGLPVVDGAITFVTAEITL